MELIDYFFAEAYELRMASPTNDPSGDKDVAMLKRDLEKALDSGVSARTAEQIRAAALDRSIIEGIERGLADMQTGNTVPHDVAMAELDALIDEIGGSPASFRSFGTCKSFIFHA